MKLDGRERIIREREETAFIEIAWSVSEIQVCIVPWIKSITY